MPEMETPDLEVSLDQICFIILKAREFDVKDVASDEYSGSNATDDDMRDVLEDHGDDPVAQEIASAVDAMSDDQQIDLVALMWLGRGDGTIEDWPDLRAEAERAHTANTVQYLLGTPLLGDHLEEGLAKLDMRCSDVM